MAHQDYDLLVIGAGAAGSTAATTAAADGKRVALVERDKIGGTCLNYGCDPTKTMIYIADVLYKATHAERFGLRIHNATFDWNAVLAWVQQSQKRIRGGTTEEAAAALKQKGIEVLPGEAAFLSAHELFVAGNAVSASQIIIATGDENVVPSIEGLDDVGYITNVQAVSLPSLPRRLAILGGGAIGIEFAQLFHRFGVHVTVLEHGPALLDKEDREVADTLCRLLSNEGLRLETSVELRRVQRDPEGKCLTIRCSKREEEHLVVDEILIAIGRRPALRSLHLEQAGVKVSEKGIAVDATLRTSQPHIWAAGDVTGALQFTHVAYEQGKLAARNAFAHVPHPFEDRVIPWVTYTNPALGHVGKTEEQVRQNDGEYRVARMFFKDVERAVGEGKTDGLVKLLVDQHGMILGGHILAEGAGDLLAPIILAMQARLSVETLASTLLPYPNMVEAVRWAADTL